MPQSKVAVCEYCTDFWDCSGSCTYRSREKRGYHTVDEKTMLKDLAARRRALRETIAFLQKVDTQAEKYQNVDLTKKIDSL